MKEANNMIRNLDKYKAFDCVNELMSRLNDKDK